MVSAPFATRYAPNGMVCAVDHLASEAGLAALRASGSAADAAIAASAVLAVTTQHMCGMGGDLFALVHHGQAVPSCLNASGRSGSGADPDRLRAEGHTEMPFRDDIRCVPLPGCVDGWVQLHERFGRLSLAEVLAPAIDYAEEGFPASPTLVGSVPGIAQVAGAEDFTAGGPLRIGQVVRRPGVARALRAIVKDGRDGFYRGEFGEGLLEVGGGEYSPEDLDRPQADWVEPIAVEAWGHRIWTVPPNSQGYLTLAGAWIAAQLALPQDTRDPLWAHLLVEAARHAAFDRRDVLHEHADGAALLSSERLEPRTAAIRADRAADLPGRFGDGGTIYLNAVDRDRMGVSLIQSNASGFGAHIVVPGVRIFLQNRGQGFALAPGHPAEYGPGRRPPHTLSPALLTRPDGRLAAVVGTMGGDSQPQVLLQLLARMLRSGESPAAAVAAGRWILMGQRERGFDTWEQRGTVRVRMERHVPDAWADALTKKGHHVELVESFGHGVGHAHVILVEDGVLAGAADPRPRVGSAAGY